jgi:DNA polymerase III sliding clamp (beta) subunit (PCNA family)
MKFDRRELFTALKNCKPALADKNPLTQLLCYYFTGESLFAYNNIIGIDVPLETDFKGGVQGALLYGMVSNSLAKQAEITLDGNDFLLKLGGSKAKFPSLPPDSAVWEFPQLPKKHIKLDQKLLDAIQHVLISATDETGVSFISEKDRLRLYSTNDRSLAWSVVNGTDLPKVRMEVPPAFCQQVLELCAAGGKLYLEEDAVMAVAENGTAIFSRLIHSEKPLDYDSALANVLPENYHKKVTEIPGRLALAYDRVLVLCGVLPIGVKHTVADAMLSLELDTNAGELREKVPLEGASYKAESAFDVALVKKGLSKMDKILFTDNCVIMTMGNHSGFVVSGMV